jgi:hypothetical protein
LFKYLIKYKDCGIFYGFKHSEVRIEIMRASKLGRNRTEDAKLKITAGNTQASSVVVTNNTDKFS